MPTWHELRQHARTAYTLSVDEETWFSLVWSLDTERTQQIVVSHYEAMDRDWIEFRSYVCKEAEMTPRVALRKNEGLGLGALALDEDGDYVLIHRAALASLDPDEFVLPLRLIAQTADELEIQQTARDDF